MREASFLFFGQLLLFAIVTFAWRAVAQGNVPLAVGTDVIYSFLTYTLVRKIAHCSDRLPARTGYICGSALGTYIGIVGSKFLTGK